MAASTDDEQDALARAGAPRSASGGRAPSDIRPDLAPAQRLLAKGAGLRFRAPELALVFAERAAALGEAAGAERLWAHAEGLAVFARVRLGQRAGVVDRAVATLRAAEADGYAELAAQMRVELALCARSVGVPLSGLAALRPVLDQPGVPAHSRAMAMLQFVGCMRPVGRREVLERALKEADELIAAERMLPGADRALLRATVYGCTAANHRRYGDLSASLEWAERGLELLTGRGEKEGDGAGARIRLVLHAVCALLDQGDRRRALDLARDVLAEPPRAATFGPQAWLRLALATRIHLPAGEAEAAARLVRDGLHGAERHDLTWVASQLWLELAQIEQAAGRDASASHCLQESRRCEFLYGRVRRQAIGLLTGEFGRGEQHVVDLPQTLAPTGGDVGHARPVTPVMAADAAPSADAAPVSDAPVTTASATPGAETPARPSEPVSVEPPSAVNTGAAQDPAEDLAEPRHRAEEGTPARSVLERLGVNVGSGGRRRAQDSDEPVPDSAEEEGGTAGPPGETEHAAEPGHQDASWFDANDPARQWPGPEDAQESVAAELAEPDDEPATKRVLRTGPPQLDSLLAVFSNWADDDSETGVVVPRARRKLGGGEPARTNGHRVNGVNGVHGVNGVPGDDDLGGPTGPVGRHRDET